MKNAFAKLFAWNGTRPLPSVPRLTPHAFGLAYEDVNFVSAAPDKTRLSGWLLTCPVEQARGVIILCHGHTSSRKKMLPKALFLRRLKFAVLLFDFRARGLSEGSHCTLGFREADDVLGAVQFLRSRPDTQSLPIGAIGESMGGASAIQAAARCQDIRAVVTEAAFASLDSAMRLRLKLLFGPFVSPVAKSCYNIGRNELNIEISEVSPESVIDQLSPRPFFLIHDKLDPICPQRESDKLFSAAREPKTRWVVPAATHGYAYGVARKEYEYRVGNFFLEHLCPNRPEEVAV